MNRCLVLTLCVFLCGVMNAQKQLSLEELFKDGKNYLKVADRKHPLEPKKDKTVKLPKAEVENCQLFVTGKDSVKLQLTTDGSREIVYGESVHRNEFGIDGGLFWNPDKSRLAFYRMDQSMVSDYPQVDIEGNASGSRIAALNPDKYPMAGETSHEVTVGVYDLKSQKQIYLNTGNPKDRYFTNISWSPDGTKIFLIEVNRDQTDASLDCYDALTGEKISTLYTEHDDKYTEPQDSILFLPWDDAKFLLQSQREGFNSLYLYEITAAKRSKSLTAKLVRSLKNADFIVTDVYGFNAETKSVIVRSAKSDRMDYNLYSISTSSGKWTLLSNGEGVHKGTLSADGKTLIDRYSTPTVPRQIDAIDIQSGKHTPWFTAKNPWQGYSQPLFKSGAVKSADGKTNLFYRMVLPSDFDESKKYPAIVYVYGGPHARNVAAGWNYCYRPWEVYMAQKGYIIFILDNRGSADRGKAFEQATFRQLGQEEMKDQMKGVEYLRSLPYVDSDKLGVHGWSFGGYMTISLMLNYPDVFKVGVAGGPVIDWRYYEVMYGERYMDTPQDNPEGYEKTSLLNKADQLNGKLLIIHGGNDKTVVPQHSLKFLKAAIDADKQVDFFIYPEEGHNMKKRRSLHLHEKITQYFLDYLR